MSEELENEVETEEIEVIEETEETEDESIEQDVPAVEDEEPSQEEEPAPAEAAATEEADELADYSESVQRRIRKLTAKYREEERQRTAALEFAEAVKKQNEELQAQLRDREAGYVDEVGHRLDREVDAAKVMLKAALEEGDADKIYDAQKRISELTLDQNRHQEAKLQVERTAQEPVQQLSMPEAPQQQEFQTQAQPDPRAQNWADSNPWFGEDESMTYAAFGIHRKLVEEEGFDPTSEEYYNEIDRRIRRDFPAKFEEAPKKAAKPRVASAESTASRSSTKGRRTVKLSQSQIAIAKKLGVPLEEYAKYVKE